MSRAPYVRIVCLLAIASFAVPIVAEAQGSLGRLRDRARDRIEQKTGEQVDRAVDRAIDGSGQTGQQDQPGAEAQPAGAAAAAGSPAARPGEGAWANYDFVPGERIVFADDFSRDRVGNFPQRFEFKSGNMEIVEWQGRRWLRGEQGTFLINLPEALPERFTMEFELTGWGNTMEISFVNDRPSYEPRLEIGTWFARFRNAGVEAQGEFGVDTKETPVSVRIAVDGTYLKLYVNERRALNVPNANPGRSNRIFISMNGWRHDHPRMIADLRIAAGGRKLYDALTAEGRVATQGILFDTGSERIRPESTPTLKEITEMLRQHPELKLRIEGHTDNVGQPAANQALSERRAAAVKAYLVGEGIAAERLESAGLGDTMPKAGNDTAEGRQTNRRVELVKL